MTDQITVNDSPLPDQLWAGVRQIAPVALAFAVGRNLIPNDAVPLLTAGGLAAWAIIAGQLKTRERAKQLASVARDPRVPDSVASIK